MRLAPSLGWAYEMVPASNNQFHNKFRDIDKLISKL